MNCVISAKITLRDNVTLDITSELSAKGIDTKPIIGTKRKA
jgi:hypothetical protein